MYLAIDPEWPKMRNVIGTMTLLVLLMRSSGDRRSFGMCTLGKARQVCWERIVRFFRVSDCDVSPTGET